MHATAFLHTARVPRRTSSCLIYAQPERIQVDHFSKDDLIGPQVAFPGAVEMLEVDLTANGREPQLAQRRLIAARPQMI